MSSIKQGKQHKPVDFYYLQNLLNRTLFETSNTTQTKFTSSLIIRKQNFLQPLFCAEIHTIFKLLFLIGTSKMIFKIRCHTIRVHFKLYNYPQ